MIWAAYATALGYFSDSRFQNNRWLALPASTPQADRPPRPRDVDDLAALENLDLAVSNKLGGSGAGRFHERAEVLANHRPSGI